MARRRSSRHPARPSSRRSARTVGAAGIGGVVALLAIGVVAGLVLDRLLDLDDILDAGGEWDEGGGVASRWD